jgi:Zn-dependent oligopeptidase
MYENLTFTVEQLAEIESNAARVNAREYLKKTDWYIVRHAETGETIPEDILQKRAAARQTASS